MQSFTELSLSSPILRAITELGYEKPSPIQAETLPILLGENTDFLGLAATGTGKTAAFGIPMLERIQPELRKVQTLILCPTRELALQVAGQITLLGKYKGVRTVAVYGGASYIDQIRGIKEGASVVVGTPGRVVDHIERGTLQLDNLKMVILDEADEMISMGFKDELEKILGKVPRESSNIWLFSATMSREVRRVADTYLKTPKQVQVNRTEMLSSTVEQYYYPTLEKNKPEVLCKLIEAADDFYGLIFCQTKSLVADLTQYLTDRGYKVDCLHGDKDQTSRERTMQSFRDRKVRVLVCTDVASRGLDVKDITHVINYSLPRELDSYVHRIGRTARSGKTGVAMNLVTQSHRRLIFEIEKMTKSRMLEGTIPSRREIGAKKIAKILVPFQDQPYHTRALEIMSDEWKAQLATMTPEQVAAHFLTMMMPDVFVERETRQRPMTNESASRSEHQPERESRSPVREREERPRYNSSPAPRAAARDERPRPSARDERPRPEGKSPWDRKPMPARPSTSAPSFASSSSVSAPAVAIPRPAADKPSVKAAVKPAAIKSASVAPHRSPVAVPAAASGSASVTGAPAAPLARHAASDSGGLLNRRARRAAQFGVAFEPNTASAGEGGNHPPRRRPN